MPRPVRKYRSHSWIDRARQQRDLDGRFICYWIAFNSLYSQARRMDGTSSFGSEAAERNGFLDLVCRTDAQGISYALADIREYGDRLLASEFLYSDYWHHGLDNDLRAKMERIATKATRDLAAKRPAGYLKAVFDRLSLLRNQIFHGCASNESAANRPSVEPAVIVLERLVPTFSTFAHDQDLPYPPTWHPDHPRADETGFNRPRVAKR